MSMIQISTEFSHELSNKVYAEHVENGIRLEDVNGSQQYDVILWKEDTNILYDRNIHSDKDEQDP